MFCGPGKQIGPVGGPINCWWLGDSETHGAIWNGATFDYEGAFRCAVYAALVARGLSPAFLGTVTNASDGVMCGGYGHSGYNGATPANWNSSYFGTYAPVVNGQGTPDLVGILLGANGADDDATADQIFGVVDQALVMWPKCSVLVQTMFKTAGTDYAVLNAGLKARAAPRSNVILVDQSGTLTLADLSDGLHPTQSGYRKLADALINAIIQRTVP